jgi:hypothetical protein
MSTPTTSKRSNAAQSDISFLGSSFFGMAAPIVLIICGVLLQNPTPPILGIRIALLIAGCVQVFCLFYAMVCNFITQVLGMVINCLSIDETGSKVGLILGIIRIILAPGCMVLAFLSPVTCIVIGAILPGGDYYSLGTAAIIVGSIQIGLGVLAIIFGICFCCCTFAAVIGIASTTAAMSNY